jgi:hypothetical protein
VLKTVRVYSEGERRNGMSALRRVFREIEGFKWGVLFFLSFGAAAQASAQGKSVDPLLLQTDSHKPVGGHQLTAYSVEELTLAEPVEAEIGGQTRIVNRAWRVNVFGGPFPVRAMVPMIWVDRTLLGYGYESDDMKKLSVIVFDKSLLRNGGTIAVSYGTADDDRTEIPAKLNLNAGQ